ncbi:MAG: carboxypeptidase-like regulatory domain-containing protein [Bacteroidia bacterium]|nr:carboxypeptidase-like regulatory domain-containing protein [Bacteroidia bacterium]
MKTLILLIVAVTAIIQIYAQEPEAVQIDGNVMYDTLRGIPFAHVYVKNSNRGTICDFWGYFNFAGLIGDTLIFSSVGYKKNMFVVPQNISDNKYSIAVYLEKDTITLPDVDIYPWKTFEQFKTVVLNIEIPEDDYERALKNFAKLKEQMQYEEAIADANLNYKYFMREKYDQLYYAGQIRPLSIFNIIAWAEFFKAIKNGDFDRKKENDD